MTNSHTRQTRRPKNWQNYESCQQFRIMQAATNWWILAPKWWETATVCYNSILCSFSWSKQSNPAHHSLLSKCGSDCGPVVFISRRMKILRSETRSFAVTLKPFLHPRFCLCYRSESTQGKAVGIKNTATLVFLVWGPMLFLDHQSLEHTLHYLFLAIKEQHHLPRPSTLSNSILLAKIYSYHICLSSTIIINHIILSFELFLITGGFFLPPEFSLAC